MLPFWQIHFLTINFDGRTTDHLQIQTGGSNDYVSFKQPLVRHHAILRELFYLSGGNRGLSRFQNGKKVAIGSQAQTLCPRIVRGIEMLLDIYVWPQELLRLPHHRLFNRGGILCREGE